jgi:hypothetical protein
MRFVFLIVLALITNSINGCATTTNNLSRFVEMAKQTPNFNWEPCRHTPDKAEFSGDSRLWRRFCDKKTHFLMAGCPLENGTIKLNECSTNPSAARCEDNGCYPIDLSGYPPRVLNREWFSAIEHPAPRLKN